MSDSPTSEVLVFRREHFSTRLPVAYRYTPSHCWLRQRPEGCWRVGLTKFATRMLGETVDHGFQVEPEAEVTLGEIIGWIEGFKAISDIYCVGGGRFRRSNPALAKEIELVNDSPYDAGWLYEFTGEPDPAGLAAQGYHDLLNATIDKLLEQQNANGAGGAT